MATLESVRGNLFKSALAALATIGLVATSLALVEAPKVEAAVISVPQDTVGINIKFKDGVDETTALASSLKLAEAASETLTIASSKAIGLGWYSIRFAQEPTDSEAKAIALALRSQPEIETTSFDFKVEIARSITPTHLITLTTSTSKPTSVAAINSYDFTAPTTGKIKVTWKKPTKTPIGYTLKGYTIRYATSPSGPWDLLSVSTSPLERVISGLEAGTQYYFNVRAKYQKKSNKSTVYTSYTSRNALATPVVKPLPVKLISGARVTNATSISASWFPLKSVTERGGDAYATYRMDVYRTDDNSKVASCPETAQTNCTVNDLVQGDYYGRIVSKNIATETPTTGDATDFAYLNLWYLAGDHGINVKPAWAATDGGSKTITVAVIDTGFTNAPILKANSWWDTRANHFYGYDFLYNSVDSPSNDGNGPDNDPTDPGDYGDGEDSSWHGTQVGSVLAGWTDTTATSIPSSVISSNSALGVAPRVKLLPVRALGPTGGSVSEVAAAINWAAGEQVGGYALNIHPAKVINLSMGTSTPQACDTLTQSAITTAKEKGVILITASGNFGARPDYMMAYNSYPGNCAGTINVGATGPTGDRAFYSNLGSNNGEYSGIDISAPGGDSTFSDDKVYCDQSSCITTTVNSGASTASNEWNLAVNQGTSFAAPVVAGVVALMVSIDSTLTINEAAPILAQTSTPFAIGTKCDTKSDEVYFECGEGIVDAYAAVAEVARLLALK